LFLGVIFSENRFPLSDHARLQRPMIMARRLFGTKQRQRDMHHKTRRSRHAEEVDITSAE